MNPSFGWISGSDGFYHLTADGSSIAKLHITPNWIYLTGVKKSWNEYLIMPEEGMSPLSISWPSFRRYQVSLAEPEYKSRPGAAEIRFAMEIVSTNNSILKFYHETTLKITRPQDSNFFSYKIESKIQMSPEVANLLIQEQRSLADHYKNFEFQDILTDGIVEWPAKTPTSKLWKWLIYEDPESGLVNLSDKLSWFKKKNLQYLSLGSKDFFKLPLNHHNSYNNTSLKSRKVLFGLENDPSIGNPVILLDQATAEGAFFVLCTWAWDLHFFYAIEIAAQKLRKKGYLAVSYSISYQNAEKLQKIYDHAQMSALVETPQFKTPHYAKNHLSDFEPSEEYRSPSDFYFWTFFEQDPKHFLWDWSNGYQSKGALKIQNDTKRKSVWYFSALGAPYLKGFALDGAYEISADVKTSNLIGEVQIGMQVNCERIDDDTRYYATTLSKTSNNEWLKIKHQTPRIKADYARIRLVLNGQGEVWWDNVFLEKLPEVEPLEPKATSP